MVGDDRDHLVPENELDDHMPREDCTCRPIEGVMGRQRHVWVHGLR